jgi:uncharacterized protein (DUF1697 family)
MAPSAPMTTQIAFLRAVNLGKRTVKMDRLVEILEGLGHDGAWTYINSGNAVFEASGKRADLESAIGDALEADLGFEVTTFVRTAAELDRILAAAPFEVGEGDTYFVTFLKDTPSKATAKELESYSNDFDTLVVRGRDVHWRMHGKSTDTTLKKRHWKIVGELDSTSRNVTMLRKLAAKIRD